MSVLERETDLMLTGSLKVINMSVVNCGRRNKHRWMFTTFSACKTYTHTLLISRLKLVYECGNSGCVCETCSLNLEMNCAPLRVQAELHWLRESWGRGTQCTSFTSIRPALLSPATSWKWNLQHRQRQQQKTNLLSRDHGADGKASEISTVYILSCFWWLPGSLRVLDMTLVLQQLNDEALISAGVSKHLLIIWDLPQFTKTHMHTEISVFNLSKMCLVYTAWVWFSKSIKWTSNNSIWANHQYLKSWIIKLGNKRCIELSIRKQNMGLGVTLELFNPSKSIWRHCINLQISTEQKKVQTNPSHSQIHSYSHTLFC